MKNNSSSKLIIFWAIIISLFTLVSCDSSEQSESADNSNKDYYIQPVTFNNVTVQDEFWLPRLETNRKATIPFTFGKCEETGRIDNFKIAAGLMEGERKGYHFDDSDVFKIMEGAAYSLQVNPDPELRKYLEDLIDVMAKAQWDDGYLYTYYSIPEKQPDRIWENIGSNHELYTAGHMYEAAVAHYLVTGDKKFLNIATKNADLVCEVFGPGKRTDPPGHQGIEIGLSKLYRVTGDEKYLDQAKFFLDQRGRKGNRGLNGNGGLYGTYSQDHIPVIEQTEAVGHSVRAAYLYTGMADVAALTGDDSYIKAIETIWQDVASTKLYITGGIGAAGGHEGFGGKYELPNMSAYCETCAAIANALWNHRMFMMTGDGKYMDIVERSVYNNVLSGISMDGESFFYPNQLESLGTSRAGWFACACCPSNIARFIPSVPGLAYGCKKKDIYVNLYIAGNADIQTENNNVTITQTSNYPWDGKVSLKVNPTKSETFSINLRIPGWARNEVVASDLYSFIDENQEKITLKVNGQTVAMNIDKGFAAIERKWKKNDTMELNLPMPVKKIKANEKLLDDQGKIAIQRGPLVYCIEWPEVADKQVLNLVIPTETKLTAEFKPDLLNGLTVISGTGKTAKRDTESGKPFLAGDKSFSAIPYYAWAHRGRGEMTVWPAATAEASKPEALPTIANTSKLTASFVHASLQSVNDQIWPKHSNDNAVLHLDFWPHQGGTEWLQYDFKQKEKISGAKVYFFEDSKSGGACKLPKSWKILYKDSEGNYKAVNNNTPYFTNGDVEIEARFEAVETESLRLEIEQPENASTGIYEWEILQ